LKVALYTINQTFGKLWLIRVQFWYFFVLQNFTRCWLETVKKIFKICFKQYLICAIVREMLSLKSLFNIWKIDVQAVFIASMNTLCIVPSKNMEVIGIFSSVQRLTSYVTFSNGISLCLVGFNETTGHGYTCCFIWTYYPNSESTCRVALTPFCCVA
jgi:hypothetical protein